MKRIFGIIFLAVFAIMFSSYGYPQGKETQGKFAVQLASALGIKGTQQECITELTRRNIIPEGGWVPEKIITTKEKADLLAKALGMETGTKLKPEIEEKFRDKAVIVKLQGTVRIMHPADKEWIPAYPGMELSSKDTIRTGPGSWVELKVGTAGGIRIKENSELSLKKISSNPDGSENIILFLYTGETLVDARGIPKRSTFEVRTPTTVAAVRGTIYKVEVEKTQTKIIKE